MLNIFRQKNRIINKKRLKAIIPIALVCFLFGLFIINPVFAADSSATDVTVATQISNGIGGAVAVIVGFVTAIFVSFFGLVLTVLVQILVIVAQFNKYINVDAVNVGWVIIRDLCNMFFVLVFLVIAFSTILRIEQYNAKKMLPKLLIMAVLINFSKTIFGIIVDMSQIIMNQFVSAFSANGPGNFINMFMVKEMLSVDIKIKGVTTDPTGFSNWTMVITFITALIAMIITVIVVGVLLLTLIIRIVMIWIYVILSPFVFLGFAFPPIAKYTGRIWDDFIKYVIVGPILAFFIYIALQTAGNSSKSLLLDASGNKKYNANATDVCAGNAGFFCSTNLQTYLITICLLIGGLMVAQQIGGAAGSIAGKGMLWAQGKAGPTPLRWGRERFEAFEGRRDQQRKEKAGMAGAKMFAAYEGLRQAPKAGLAGVRALTTAKIPGISDIPAVKKWQDTRQEKSRAREHIYDAYNDLKDKAAGETFEKGGYVYGKNIKGGIDVVNAQGSHVASMSKAGAEFRQAARVSYSPAKQIMDEVTHARVQKQSKNFDNLSGGELKRILSSAMNTKDQRIAAAMMLNQKGKFDNRDQLQSAKSNLSGLPTLLKEFNQTADKRFGSWNNSVKDDRGSWVVDENTLEAKVADGTINITDIDTKQLIGDKKTVDLVAKISGAKLGENLDRMARTDKDRKNIVEALENDIGGRQFTGDDNRIRKALSDFSGNMQQSFHSDSMGGVNRIARQEAIKNMKSKALSRVDANTIDNDMNFQDDFANSISLSQLKSFERSGESPEKLRKYVQIIKARANQNQQIDDLINQISNDSTLKSI